MCLFRTLAFLSSTSAFKLRKSYQICITVGTRVRLCIHYCTAMALRAFQKTLKILGNMLFMQESWLKVQILINLVCALFLTSVLKRDLHAPSTPSIIIDISIEIFGVESLSL